VISNAGWVHHQWFDPHAPSLSTIPSLPAALVIPKGQSMKFWMSSVAKAAAVAVIGLTALSAQAETKQDLIKQLPSLQASELDALAAEMAQGPVRQIGAQAQQLLLQIVPPEKREATAQSISTELKKFVEASTPTVQASAKKLAPQVVAPIIESKFSEAELRDLVNMLNSPVFKRYQGLLPELSQAAITKISDDVRPTLMPKAQAVNDTVAKIIDKASGGKLSQAQAAAQKNAAPANAAPAKPAAKK
jgi:uncharacterized protein